MIAPNEATRRQLAAADPTTSTWLAANAGQGNKEDLMRRTVELIFRKLHALHTIGIHRDLYGISSAK